MSFARAAFSRSSRISCCAAGARTSFSRPSASTFAFTPNRPSSSKSGSCFNLRSNGLSSILNNSRAAFATTSPINGVPNISKSNVPGTSKNSTPSASASTSAPSSSTSSGKTSTASSSSSGSSGVSAARSSDESSDGNMSDLSESSGRQWDFHKWPYANTFIPPRLEDYYRLSLVEDLIVLLYDHESPDASLDVLQGVYGSEWMPRGSVGEVFLRPVEELEGFDPVEPVTSIITHRATTYQKPKVKRLKSIGSMVDYANVKRQAMIDFLTPEVEPPKPYAPLPSRIPVLKSITLKIWHEEAANNKTLLIPAIMSLQAISGVRADPIFAERGDASKKIREGMPLGCKVVLTHSRMYSFLDKLTQCVLPRLSEFEGFYPVGDGNGKVVFEVPASGVGYFPDVESYFEMFPKLFSVEVECETSARGDQGAVLLLSGMQVPFMDAREVVREEEEVESDPWAKFKKKKGGSEKKDAKKK